MASSKEYLDFILEQLSELNDITHKAKEKQLITQITVVVGLDVGAWNTINPDDESE